MQPTPPTPPQRNLKLPLLGLGLGIAVLAVVMVNRGSTPSEAAPTSAKKTSAEPAKGNPGNGGVSEPGSSAPRPPASAEVDLGVVTEKILAQGATDLPGALAALAAQPEAVRAATAPIILRMFAAQDPKRCADWALANLGGGIESGLHPVFSQWVASDPTDAVDWLLAMDVKLASALAPLLAKHLGGEAAVEFADQIMTFPASGERDALALLTLSNWAERSPQEAVAWAQEQAAQFPLGISAAVSSWAQGNFTSAEAWTRELPEGQQRDLALQALSEVAFEKTPGDGVKLATEIGNLESRSRLMKTLFSNWQKQNAAEATEWMKQNETLFNSALLPVPTPSSVVPDSGK